MFEIRALRRSASISVAVLALVGSLSVLAVVRPGSARAAAGVNCTTSSPGALGRLTITISGGSTSSSAPLSIAVSSGHYVIDLSGSPVCAGTLSDSATSGFPNVVVDSTPAAGQYVVLDNTNGQFASQSAACPVQVTTTANVSGTLELHGDATPAATGDATIGVGSGSASLAISGCSSDVTPGSGITTLVTKGEASANTLDLSGAPGPLTVDASAAPQKVTGFSSANVIELDFSSEQTVVGSTSGSTKFVAGAAAMTFTGQGTGNSLDLSALATSQSTRGTVNVSGGSANSVANNTATAGSTTDQFTAVTSFTGPTTGDTAFLAASTGGYAFTGQGSNDSLDLSASGSGATIDVPAGSVTIGTATDSFSGIPTFTGPAVGNNRFVAASSSNDTFADSGNGNMFVAGPSSNDTFNAVGNGNTLDLSALTAPTLNVSGTQVAGTPNETATAGTSTYAFVGSNISSFIGSSTGATTFLGGTGADTFTGQSTNNTLSYGSVSGPTVATLDAHDGTATLGNVVEHFNGIATLAGLSAGNTTFRSGSGGGQTFTAYGSGNTLDVSLLTSPTIDVPNGKIHFGALTDSFSGVSSFIGANTGNTTLIAPSTPISFFGQALGNALDLSAVFASPSRPATVNVSGGLGNDTVTSSGNPTDQFTAVNSFTGPSTGNTTFRAASEGGYTFTGQGSSDALDLSASGSGATIDVPAGSVTIGTATDSFSGIPTFTGPAVGNNRFVAASSSNDTFVGNGNGNTFVAASSSNDTFVGNGNGNTLDLSALTAPTLNVSGTQIGAIPNNTATAGTSTYSFVGSNISSFIGSSTGATTFLGGTGADTFTGQSTNNTLSYGSVSGPTVATLDAHDGTATLDNGVDHFSGIATLAGLSAGNTRFVPGSGGGQTFTANGSGNTLDVSPLTSPTIDVPNGKIHFGALTDSFTGIPTFTGASTGNTTLIAPTTAISFTGQGSGNALDLSAVPSSPSTPATVNVSGSTANSVANDTATAGTSTYTFSGVSSFEGSSTGATTFLAGSAGGNTFTGQGAGDTLDLTAAEAAVKVDAHSGVASWASTSDGFDGIGAFLVPASGGNTFVAGPASATFIGGSGNTLDLSALTAPTLNVSGANVGATANDTATAGTSTDTFSGVSSFEGSSTGATTFLAGSAGGNTFTGQGAGDTLDLTAAGAAVKVDAHSGVASWASTSDGFDGIGAFLVPASGGNTFVAGPASATFIGGSGNTLDLSPVSGPSSLTVTMAGGNCSAGSVAVTSPGPAPITDCVGGTNTVEGAAVVPTTFVPDPNLTAPPAPPVTFVGNDTSSNGSILDLSALTSPDAGGHQVSGLTTAMNRDSNSSPGSVTANVDTSPVSFASFSGITELIGSSSLSDSFQRGSTTNLTLVGIAKLPQSVTFTSSPPSSAIVRGTYVPTTAGGLSQEPVVITIDPSTAGACSASGGTVRFTAPGPCLIDANEAGNGEFAAAPPAQQTVVIRNPPITSHTVAAQLATEIVPSKRLRIGSLAKAGGFTLRFKALEAGTASIGWYQLAPGAHLARKQFPVLVAAGKLKFSAAGTRNLRLKLTPAGRRLLRNTRRITLTAKGTFTPAGARPISSMKRFALRR